MSLGSRVIVSPVLVPGFAIPDLFVGRTLFDIKTYQDPSRRHVWLWACGLGLVLLALPLRWLSLTDFAWSLVITYGLYLIVSLYVHKGGVNRYVLLLPPYAAFSSLVMTPLGICRYFVMAMRDRNPGIITLHALTDSPKMAS